MTAVAQRSPRSAVPARRAPSPAWYFGKVPEPKRGTRGMLRETATARQTLTEHYRRAHPEALSLPPQ
jgi:hypothetical protein